MIVVQIVRLLLTLINVYSTLLAVYALLSWFPQAYATKLGQWIRRLCDPYLSYFDRFQFGGLSFSVILGIFVLQLLSQGIVAIARMIL